MVALYLDFKLQLAKSMIIEFFWKNIEIHRYLELRYIIYSSMKIFWNVLEFQKLFECVSIS